MKKIRDEVRLGHIRNASAYIIEQTQGKEKTVITDNITLRLAIERQLEIIGEASNHVSDGLKARFADIPWQNVVAFRSFIAHENFGIDFEFYGQLLLTRCRNFTNTSTTFFPL